MFTGIIEELGEVTEVRHLNDSAVLSVRGRLVTSDATAGSSIAVNGTCLTVTALDGDTFAVDVMAESLSRTSLGRLTPGDQVNLERAMAASSRFAGHVVQGHVDGTGEILSRTPATQWEVVEISCPPHVRRYLVEKGSIAVDGVSLSVYDIRPDRFTVSLIPTTLAVDEPRLRRRRHRGQPRADILGKYVVAHLDHLEPGAAQEVTRG
jgi:riboflavin synthase